MDNIVYALLALGVLSLALFLYVRVKKGGILGLLTKTLASIFFIATAVVAFMFNPACDRFFGMFIVLGLVFGLLGDVFLDLKYCYPKDNDLYTFTGMGCFAMGHISYLLGIYLTFYTGDLLTLLIPIAVAVVFAAVVIVGGPMLGMKYGKFKVPALIYAFLLTFMLCANAAFMIVSFSPFWLVMTLGGLMFILSDLALSQTYFVYKKKEGFENEVLVYENNPVFVIFIHITYYAAQFLIAISLFLF